MAATKAESASNNSSVTSTSHTMTHLPAAPKTTQSGDGGARSTHLDLLKSALEPASRHVFLQPTKEICDAAIENVKVTLDEVASALWDEQNARRANGKRKRGTGDGEELRVKRIYTEGFDVDQIWEQTKRVVDGLNNEVARVLEEMLPVEADRLAVRDESKGVVKAVRFGTDGYEVDSEDDESLEENSDTGSQDEFVEEVEGEDDPDADIADAFLNGLEEEDDYEEDEDEDEDGEEAEEESAEVFVEDSHGLNDGFFSIDQFNKRTDFLERQDAAGDLYTGEASDEEEIDWDADPMGISAAPDSKSKRRSTEDLDDDEEDSDSDGEDDDGPTFGNVDLNAPEGDSEDENEGEDDEMDDMNETGENTNDILYKDFFEPPPRKAGKGERQAKYLERQAKKPKDVPMGDQRTEVERAMADVRRDLFEESDHESAEDDLSDVDPGLPKSRKSAHERRQNKIGEEIRRLEAASVAKREWTLAGEATAADRPLNSLLEEDLDFERTGKPVPVITAEVSENIDELIKRRIIAQEFDEVIRRRPDAESVPENTRRGAFDLEDTKSKQSLAEIYAEEHVKASNPGTYVSKADEKLKKQHQEIEQLWKSVSAKLDALSSWYFKPKPPVPGLTVVSDIATISMEDAQPSTAAGVAGADSMLAPQEIYKSGKDKAAIEKGEIVPKTGAPVARQEMTREQKLRRRRREKERIRKSGGVGLNGKKEGKKTKEKRETLGELKRAGVKIIDGKGGEITEADGSKVKTASSFKGADNFKL